MIEGILLRNGHFGVDAGPENLRLFGGASRDRTDDLIVANDALSQLSYSPTNVGNTGKCGRQCDTRSRLSLYKECPTHEIRDRQLPIDRSHSFLSRGITTTRAAPLVNLWACGAAEHKLQTGPCQIPGRESKATDRQARFLVSPREVATRDPRFRHCG